MNSFIYRGHKLDNSNFQHEIYTGYQYYRKHFCSITSMTGLFATAYYCETCEFPYDSLTRHHCDSTCQTRPVCQADGKTDKQSTECNKTLNNLTAMTNIKLTRFVTKSNYVIIVANIGKNIMCKAICKYMFVVHTFVKFAVPSNRKVTFAMSVS